MEDQKHPFQTTLSRNIISHSQRKDFFQDKNRFQKFTTMKPALETMLEGVHRSEKKVKHTQRQGTNNSRALKQGPNRTPKINKMMEINEHSLILTFNIGSINSSIKRHKLVNWIRIQNPSFDGLPPKHAFLSVNFVVIKYHDQKHRLPQQTGTNLAV